MSARPFLRLIPPHEASRHIHVLVKEHRLSRSEAIFAIWNHNLRVQSQMHAANRALAAPPRDDFDDGARRRRRSTPPSG